MIREYIIKVNEDKKDIMGDCPLVEKPKELVRCKDCKYAILTYSGECKYCEKRMDDDGGMDQLYLPGDWYCADGERKDGEQE